MQTAHAGQRLGTSVPQTLDEEFARIADQVPGFGGAFYDSTGVLTVVLKDASALQQTQPKVLALLDNGVRMEQARRTKILSDVSGMRVRQGTHDSRELLTWYRGHVAPAAQGFDGLTMTDIDERKNRIVVGVRDPALVDKMREFLGGLDVPAGALEVLWFPAVERASSPVSRAFLAAKLPPPHSLSAVIRPAVGGLKVTSYVTPFAYPCTLGFNVVARINGVLQADRYFVTASHCAPPQATMNGVSTAQPQAQSWIGAELVDPAWKTYPSDPYCLQGRLCRYSDASLFKYSAPGDAAHGLIALPPVGSTSYYAATTVIDLLGAFVGWPAHMIGQASGHASGTIQNSCVDLIPYEGGQPTDITLWCQGMANYGHQNNDSGSPVIEPVGDGLSAYLLGVHWGGQSNSPFYGLFSPISGVMGELAEAAPSLGELDPTAPQPPPPPPPPSAIISGKSVVRPGNPCTWTASVSNGVAPFGYTWYQNSIQIATGTLQVTASFSQNGAIQFKVIDSLGRWDYETKSVTVSPTAPLCLF